MTNSNESSKIIHLSDKEIVDSDLFYRSLFEYNPDIVFFSDTHGIIANPNGGFSEILGYPKEEIVLSSLERFLPSSEISLYRESTKKALSGKIQHMDTVFLHKNGNPLSIFLTMIPAKFEEKVIGIFGIAKNFTIRKQIERSLIEAELKFQSLVEEASFGVFIIQNGQIIYGNPGLYKLIGLDIFTHNLDIWEYVHPEDHPNLRAIIDQLMVGGEGAHHYFRMIKKDGALIYVEYRAKKICYQNNYTIIGTLQDITERKKAEDLNRYLANHDPLTELPNRRLFQEKIKQELTISKTLQQKLAVMYLDLDRFKYVNDTLGHPIGDTLLKQIAKRLKRLLGEQNVLARMAGDEFAVLLPNIRNASQVIEHSKKIIESLEDPFLIDEYKLFITTSIGISIFPQDGGDSQTLLKHADSALYKAKEKGKNTYQIHTSSMDVETYKMFNLETNLREALELNQLELYYQPKVCAANYQIIGAEALIRWNHPEWGIVSPNEFIPLAEETGIIIEIDKWIKYTACSQNKAWQDAGLPAIPVSINLSAHRFLGKDLISSISQILKETKLNPEYLEIEILETALLENDKVVFSILDELRSLGIRISLDDFGTGYSSLSYLQRYKGRIDTLKIDRTFINNLSQSDLDDSNFITKTIIQLAQHLEMNVVAEGVETKEQLKVLQNYKCNTIQGYLFSKPVPADEFETLLRKGKIEISSVSNADKNSVLENRRKFFRFKLDFPLSASMTLIRFHGRQVELGRTEVLLENIGLGGLCFISDISLPVQREILLEIETEILGNMIKVYGEVVWMEDVKSGIYQYGLEFSMEESERTGVTQLLNKLAILLRKNPLVPNCSFVTMDPSHFFKTKNEKKI